MFLGVIWPSRLMESQIGESKYGTESIRIQTTECLHWRGPAAVIDISTEIVPHANKWQLSDSNKNLPLGPRCVADTRTDWPIDCLV
jgi:hypothetical protein